MKSSEGLEAKIKPNELIWEEKSREFEVVLKIVCGELDLNPGSVRHVASLGCGLFWEAKALVGFFPNAKIEGFDAKSHASLAKDNSSVIPQEVEVVIGDLRREEIYKGREPYDVLVVRNPDIHHEENWRQILKNGVNHLKEDGLIVSTCATDFEKEQIERTLKDQDLEIKISWRNPGPHPNRTEAIVKDAIVIAAQKL